MAGSKSYFKIMKDLKFWAYWGLTLGAGFCGYEHISLAKELSQQRLGLGLVGLALLMFFLAPKLIGEE